MTDDVQPLDLVIPGQFIDLTKRRVSSFFGDGIVAHVGWPIPCAAHLGDLLEKAARGTGARVHRGGTYVCIEGPQFSTRAESRVYRSWGVDVIGMTNMPRRSWRGRPSSATRRSRWRPTTTSGTRPTRRFSVEAVIANLGKNVATAKAVLARVIPMIGGSRVCECPSLLKAAVITSPAAFPHATRRRLDLLIGKYFPQDGRGRPASRAGHPRHTPASRTPLQ